MEDEGYDSLFDVEAGNTDIWVNPNSGIVTEAERNPEGMVSVSPVCGDEFANPSPQTATAYEISHSPIFSASGRRIPSALKRRGLSPQTPRKRVSFTMPDVNGQTEDSDGEDVGVEILTLDTTPKPAAFPSNSYITSVQQTFTVTNANALSNGPALKSRLPLTDVTTFSDRLPSIPSLRDAKEETVGSETGTPATFKSLRTKLRGMAPVRTRKSLPPPEPLKICLHCKGSLVSHAELKTVVDNAIHYFKDARVTCLQYDPLAIWSGDPGALNRWVISLSDQDACHYLTGTGLHIHGQHYNLISYDDVMSEEYRIFKMKQEILQESKRVVKAA